MDNINELLKKSGLKKKYIAEKLGITPTTLSAKLSGKSAFTKPELFMLESILKNKEKEDKGPHVDAAGDRKGKNMDKMEYNGKKVLLNKNHNNAAISVKVLDEEEMRRIGFTDFAKDRWYYCKMVNKRCDISFSITIPKKNPEDWRIDILDEAFCQPYDYQYMLSHGSKNAIALSVNEKVEEQMQYLTENSVISGHERGDYI